MKISIVIPIYNVEKYIVNCLLSVVNQKKNIHTIECILVDDCGSDNSIKIASNFIKQHEKDIEFKLVKHKYNRGLSAARNTGLAVCSGDYVLFLDSDDTLPEDCIYNLSNPLNTYLYDFVIGDVEVLGDAKVTPSLLLEEGAYIGNKIIRETYLEHKWYMMAWNKLYNLNFLRSKNLTFEEGLIHEDDMWSFILSLHAENLYVVRKQTYRYMIRGGSITNNKKQAIHIEAYLTIANNITHYIRQYNLASSYVLFCHQYILGTYIYLRCLGIVDGYQYFRKIVSNDLYSYYYETLLLQESNNNVLKIKLVHFPKILSYCIFRVSFLLTNMKHKFNY